MRCLFLTGSDRSWTPLRLGGAVLDAHPLGDPTDLDSGGQRMTRSLLTGLLEGETQ